MLKLRKELFLMLRKKDKLKERRRWNRKLWLKLWKKIVVFLRIIWKLSNLNMRSLNRSQQQSLKEKLLHLLLLKKCRIVDI